MEYIKRVFAKINKKIYAKDIKNNVKRAYKANKADFDRNAKLNNSRSGRCFILGNGPSSKEVDFDLLKNEDVFVVNLFAKFPNYEVLNPNYYVIMDPFLLSGDENNKDRIEKIIEVGKKCPSIQYFLPQKVKEYAYLKTIENNNEVYFLQPTNRIANSFDNPPLLSSPAPDFGNVVLHALYIAICMGYKEIYLLGCDETSIITIINAHLGFVDDSAYGYALSDEARKKIIEDCTQLPFERSLRQIAETFGDFATVNRYGEKFGVKIFNCSKNSLLKCFKYIDYKDVLK